jgi:hypothetical protein
MPNNIVKEIMETHNPKIITNIDDYINKQTNGFEQIE